MAANCKAKGGNSKIKFWKNGKYSPGMRYICQVLVWIHSPTNNWWFRAGFLWMSLRFKLWTCKPFVEISNLFHLISPNGRCCQKTHNHKARVYREFAASQWMVFAWKYGFVQERNSRVLIDWKEELGSSSSSHRHNQSTWATTSITSWKVWVVVYGDQYLGIVVATWQQQWQCFLWLGGRNKRLWLSLMSLNLHICEIHGQISTMTIWR